MTYTDWLLDMIGDGSSIDADALAVMTHPSVIILGCTDDIDLVADADSFSVPHILTTTHCGYCLHDVMVSLYLDGVYYDYCFHCGDLTPYTA